ncbi:shikimate kinase [Neobacillus sp. WH10]|uniref:shikimate kinase n=1 Tax=Neobacillus sp. WH10 TaxID=3047873 RepID=UPI0024C15931|nr:shikimate kinase [Neobacillus sp. WH10]WHY78765.1 shikimate kinase [Neobacillus sp. WH10]
MNNDREKSIVFIGFMGVGKTTIGKLVAEKLNREFIDIDEEIEKEYGMKVSEIFNKIGERSFREKEKSVITSLCEQKNKVLSLGGGAFLQREIRKVCLSASFVIFLDLSFDNWKERISQIIESRPILQGKSIDEIKELFYKRQEIYSNHHLKVITDNQDPEEIAKLIINKLTILM